MYQVTIPFAGQYVDMPATFAACRLATTNNITLSGLSSVDTTSTNPGERILVRAQTTVTENGIWIAQLGGWGRAYDMPLDALLPNGLLCYVREGTTFADHIFVIRAAAIPGPQTIQVGVDTLAFKSTGLT